MPGRGPVRIRCDYRERRGYLFQALRDRRDVALDIAHLRVGDYVVEERVTVERKTWTDFFVSLECGRLFRQAAALKKHAERPVLLVEGPELEAVGSRVPPSVRGALASLSVMWYLPVLRVADAREAADLLVTIGRQWTRDRRETWTPPPRPLRRARDPRIPFLRCLPGVGPQLARRLLDRFGSLGAICNASRDDLASVRGIGKRRAKVVRSLLAERGSPTRTF